MIAETEAQRLRDHIDKLKIEIEDAHQRAYRLQSGLEQRPVLLNIYIVN
jgi:hypothetical protein